MTGDESVRVRDSQESVASKSLGHLPSHHEVLWGCAVPLALCNCVFCITVCAADSAPPNQHHPWTPCFSCPHRTTTTARTTPKHTTTHPVTNHTTTHPVTTHTTTPPVTKHTTTHPVTKHTTTHPVTKHTTTHPVTKHTTTHPVTTHTTTPPVTNHTTTPPVTNHTTTHPVTTHTTTPPVTNHTTTPPVTTHTTTPPVTNHTTTPPVTNHTTTPPVTNHTTTPPVTNHTTTPPVTNHTTTPPVTNHTTTPPVTTHTATPPVTNHSTPHYSTTAHTNYTTVHPSTVPTTPDFFANGTSGPCLRMTAVLEITVNGTKQIQVSDWTHWFQCMPTAHILAPTNPKGTPTATLCPDSVPQVPPPPVTQSDGKCYKDRVELALGFPGATLSLAFAQDSTNFYLEEVNVTLLDKESSGMFGATVREMEAPLGQSFSCDLVTLKVTSSLVVTASKVQAQAFQLNGSDYGPAKSCYKANMTVPIVVGIILLVLILVVVLAYFIGRRRRTGGYEML
uniref:Uncharacterized protein n=1 Tax=Xenopus tropicalis TaxID=8364 RepID=A0A1B8XWB1_XENTR